MVLIGLATTPVDENLCFTCIARPPMEGNKNCKVCHEYLTAKTPFLRANFHAVVLGLMIFLFLVLMGILYIIK